MATPQQGWIDAESKNLAKANRGKDDQATEEDHFAHAAGRTCKACGRAIQSGQNARRRGEEDWVHDVCPAGPANREDTGR